MHAISDRTRLQAAGLLLLALLSAATSGFTRAAGADAAYPGKPVRFIVPYAPGGNGDIVSRIIAQHLAAALGQQVVIDNRGGAGGNIGAELAARAAPDGYTIVLGTNTHAINMSLYRRPGYDLAKDFAPITLLTSAPMVLMVHPALPARSVKALLALAKARPGALNYGSGGSGSSPHIIMELFKTMSGIDLVHVPYKGVSQAMTDLFSGQLQVMFNSPATALTNMRAGRVRGLAVSTAKRSALVPDLPALAEAGVPGFDASIWQGLLAPARTPRQAIDALNREVAAQLRRPEVKQQFTSHGVEPGSSTPEQFASYIDAEIAKWAEVVRKSGAKVD